MTRFQRRKSQRRATFIQYYSRNFGLGHAPGVLASEVVVELNSDGIPVITGVTYKNLYKRRFE